MFPTCRLKKAELRVEVLAVLPSATVNRGSDYVDAVNGDQPAEKAFSFAKEQIRRQSELCVKCGGARKSAIDSPSSLRVWQHPSVDAVLKDIALFAEMYRILLSAGKILGSVI